MTTTAETDATTTEVQLVNGLSCSSRPTRRWRSS